jgi:phenylacetate-coenzyme A ligase PaaK-like adenylate-forming protein
MSNPVRNTYQFHNSYVPNLTCLYLKATIGASGAPTINALQSMGIDSISRTSAGKYLINLNKKYDSLRMAKAVFIASGGANAPDLAVDTDAVRSAGTLTVVTQAGGVNTDPASGEVMLIEIMLKDSSVATG